jgi:hypothetical protein
MGEDYSYLYFDESREEADDMASLLRERFWTVIRSSLYKKICKGKGGFTQWAYITGRKSRDSKNRKIVLSKDSLLVLEKIVNYLNSSDGIGELVDVGVLNPPEHYDDLIGIIRESMNVRDMQREEFLAFLKHKNRVLFYLSKVL